MEPFSCTTFIRAGTSRRNSPLGPETVTRPGSIATRTPAGTSIGLFPIRLISLPDLAQHLAADPLGLRRSGRDDAVGRGEDRDAEAAAPRPHAPGLAGVDAAAG